jgi:hypothetical protein
MKNGCCRSSAIASIVVMISCAVPAMAQNLAPQSFAESVPAQGADACDDGVVKDDGTLESGYGWVPSAVDGRYVQRFEVEDFRSRKIDEVCVCWTHTIFDEDEITFNVQLYRDRGGRPAGSPDASVEAVATLVPTFPDGAFYSVDVSDLHWIAPTNVFYLGVQWDPSIDQFFFVCVDQSPETPIVNAWFVDDRADGWTSVLESNDPIFDEHRAMMIRGRAAEGTYALVPTLGEWGITILILVLAAVGVALIRRQIA